MDTRYIVQSQVNGSGKWYDSYDASYLTQEDAIDCAKRLKKWNSDNDYRVICVQMVKRTVWNARESD